MDDDIEDNLDDPEYTPPHPPTLMESAFCVALCLGYAAVMVWVSAHAGGPTR